MVMYCFVKGNFEGNSAATTDVLCHNLSNFLGWIVFMGAKTAYQFAQLAQELTQCCAWRTHVCIEPDGGTTTTAILRWRSAPD